LKLKDCADEKNAYKDAQDETGRNENNNRNVAKNQSQNLAETVRG